MTPTVISECRDNVFLCVHLWFTKIVLYIYGTFYWKSMALSNIKIHISKIKNICIFILQNHLIS